MKSPQPITEKERPDWDKLISETRKVVALRDKHQFKLILLAGQVTTKYGEDRLGKWAEEAGLSYTTAKQYRWLAKKGIDEAFIEKWVNKHKLAYSVIREIASNAGSLTSIYALEYLQWAVDHKASVVSIRAYMLEVIAPQNLTQERHKEIKMALADKQEHEGFSDFIKARLEEMVDQYPEAEDAILNTAITKVDDLEALKIAAGVVEAEEQSVVDDAAKLFRKLDGMKKWLLAHREEVINSIKFDHEMSQELKDVVGWLHNATRDINATEIPEFNYDPSQVEDMDLG